MYALKTVSFSIKIKPQDHHFRQAEVKSPFIQTQVIHKTLIMTDTTLGNIDDPIGHITNTCRSGDEILDTEQSQQIIYSRNKAITHNCSQMFYAITQYNYQFLKSFLHYNLHCVCILNFSTSD